ncbi:MAG: DUF2312 domain-containing protein [Magnetococcales bacterium]|nr:DUF2312 domain-containing protein [Magnetococcales bacterium]
MRQEPLPGTEKTEAELNVEAEQLRQFIEKVERLEEEKLEIATLIRDVFAEAKAAGFDPKVMRIVIRQRKMDQREVDEEETLVHLYKRALGMLV